jgi:hypothetical protein
MTLAFVLTSFGLFAQQPDMQFFVTNDKDGLNQFETSKDNQVEFTGLKARLGGDFALQFQGLSQTNAGDSLAELASNFNLPTANLNIDVQLADGVRMHMRTYLSSKHHTEAYVKGGYMQIDNLNFISDGFASGFMNMATIKFGMDEINYGDTHFRRSDNARAIFNPFVGNYIMDSFTTEPYGELTIQTNGLLIVAGATNGRLNQSPLPGDDGFAIFGKLGYDSQINDDLRVRLTASFYSSNDKGTRDYIYGGDRAGGRYYKVFAGGDFDGRFNPRYAYQTAFQINPFVKFQGLEFFGVYEMMNNGDDAVGGGFSQLGAELLYRLGSEENFYLGGRYNSVSGTLADGGSTLDISRLNVGGGWFLTKNVLAKIEYMNQTYSNSWKTTSNSDLTDANAKGIVFEAVISF